MVRYKFKLLAAVHLAAILALDGCDSGSDGNQQFSIGGTVSGLANGESLALENNGEASPLIVSADGPFSFLTPVAVDGTYRVTVDVQPTGQVCTVSNGSGAGVTADVTGILVTCAASTFSISGNVAGLAAGTEVVLENNGADALTISHDGAFAFSSPVAFNSSYAVSVSAQPSYQTCTVSNSTGAGIIANVSDVSIVCSTNSYSVGGIITGLAAGLQVTLDNNGANPLTLAANGSFTFGNEIAAQGSYTVTVGTQPVGQTCTVSNGSGSNLNTNVASVVVTCSEDTFTVGGLISGLAGGMQVTLENNGADPQTMTANGPFVFVTPVALGGSYAVTVATQPVGQSCSVSGGTGVNITANVTTVSINCQ
jgi:hypothetical protein